MRIDSNTTHQSTGSADAVSVSESAKRQIAMQASETNVLPGAKFLDSAFLDSPRAKKSQ
jgi:hypothetical protein